jgi:helix-turn-helix protein
VSFLLATPTTTVLARAVDDVKNKKINENDTNAADESIKHSTSNTPSTTTTTTTKTPDTSFTEQSIRIAQKKVQQDRANQMKNYWKRTFAEIKDLQVFFPETCATSDPMEITTR